MNQFYNSQNVQQPQYQVNRPIYQPMMQQQQQWIPQGLKGRPVASIEEVRGSIIDFDGSIFYFPDLANKRIYTKQINVDGTATLNVYELQEVPTTSEPQFVTREEFEAAIQSLRQMNGTIGQETLNATDVPSGKPAGAGVVLNF